MGNTLSLSSNIQIGEDIRNIFSPYRRDTNLLQVKMNALRSTREGMEGKIRLLEVDPCKKVLPGVKNWIASVDNLDSTVVEILNRTPETVEGRENGNLWTWTSCLYSSFRSNCRHGNDIRKALEVVMELESHRGRWGDDNLVEDIPYHSIHTYRDLPERIHSSSGSKAVVGMEGLMSKLLKFLANDEVGVIGVYGMGGVGKTTLINQLLVKHIRGSCSSSSELVEVEGRLDVMFDRVILVVVSQNLDIAEMQENIGKQLGLSEKENFKGRDQTARADFLSTCLSRMRFFLVLDDMWKDFDLSAVGIPHPHRFGNRCKVILTTRDVRVCVNMGVNRKGLLKVDCLNEEHSWELFKGIIGWDEFRFRDVLNIAEEMVSRSGGLPLVLVTIARAMLVQETVQQWRNALYTLKNFPRRIHGMDAVFRLLKSSYDNLKDDRQRYCLQFMALFSENKHIPMSEMVDCIGGAFLVDGGSNIVGIRNTAADMVTQLLHACLLEVAEKETYDQVFPEKVVCVKLHSALRDTILDSLDSKTDMERKILPFAIHNDGDGIYVLDVESCHSAMTSPTKTSSVLSEEHEHICCRNSNMNVPLLHSGWVVNYPTSLFDYFPNLRVLNLSWTRNLEVALASVCQLKLLQYLDLSNSQLETLPKEMGNLRSLVQLDLSHTSYLRQIPDGIFSSLSKLQSLDLFHCNFFHGFTVTPTWKKIQVLKEIGDLPLLKDFRLFIEDDGDAVKFLVNESDSISNSINKIEINGVDLFKDDGPLFPRIVKRFKKLEWLKIHALSSEDKDLRIDDHEGFPELKFFRVSGPHFRHIIIPASPLKELTCLVIYTCFKLRNIARHWRLPNLRSLCIGKCDGMVDLVDASQYGDFLPKLEHIRLLCMRYLVRISSSPLQLASLVKFEMIGCPMLEDISMVSSPNDVKIRCTKKLWERQLRWENHGGAPPPNFVPSCFLDEW